MLGSIRELFWVRWQLLPNSQWCRVAENSRLGDKVRHEKINVVWERRQVSVAVSYTSPVIMLLPLSRRNEKQVINTSKKKKKPGTLSVYAWTYGVPHADGTMCILIGAVIRPWEDYEDIKQFTMKWKQIYFPVNHYYNSTLQHCTLVPVLI